MAKLYRLYGRFERCKAKTRSGTRCRNAALGAGRETCFVHSKDLMAQERKLHESIKTTSENGILGRLFDADLAVFVAERNDGRTWQLVLDEWNGLRGERATSVAAFARKARSAYKTITGKSLVWKGGGGGGAERLVPLIRK